jgi:hypothetical protein
MHSKHIVLSVFAAFASLGACTVAVTSGDGSTGTTSGAGGTSSSTQTTTTTAASTTSTGGASGVGGSGGGAGTGGGAGLADAGGDAGSDAAQCIDGSDAGNTPNPDLCSGIAAYVGVTCQDAMGPYVPPGLSLCQEMQNDARPGAFRVFYDCINAESKTTTPCSVQTNDDCVARWPTDCQVGQVTVPGASVPWDCSNLVAKCPAYKQADCDFIMNVFNDAARSKIFGCYLTKFNRAQADGGSTDCKTDFDDCVQDPAHMP